MGAECHGAGAASARHRAGDGAPRSRPDHLRGLGFGQAALGDDVAYAATKTAQVALVRGFAERFAPDGVAINSVLPGPVDTPLWRGANEQLALARDIATEQVEQEIAAALPRGKVAQTVELADVIVFLASPRAANVIGAAWTVDGGSARQLF